MRNAAILLVIAVLGLINGLGTDQLPAWRQVAFIAIAVAAYLHGSRLPVRHGWYVLVGVAISGVAISVVNLWEGVTSLASLALCVVLPWLVGRFRLQQAELVRRMEREQGLIAERARLRERNRIAAEMHDTLGHELALIALRAGALELASGRPEAARAAAAELRLSAVTATDRLRQTIGLLRDDDAAPVRPPDESIEALVERAQDAGMNVSLSREGTAAALPEQIEHAIHRVTQEALTNVARHAPGAAVTVQISQAPTDIEVTVTNDTTGGSPSAAGNGSGLTALTERVELLGGTFHAGPDGDRFTVTARIPTGER